LLSIPPFIEYAENEIMHTTARIDNGLLINGYPKIQSQTKTKDPFLESFVIL